MKAFIGPACEKFFPVAGEAVDSFQATAGWGQSARKKGDTGNE